MAYQTQEEKREPFDEQFFQDIEEQQIRTRQQKNRQKRKERPGNFFIGFAGVAICIGLITGYVSSSSRAEPDETYIVGRDHQGEILIPIVTTDEAQLPVPEMTVFDNNGKALWNVFEVDENGQSYDFNEDEPDYTLSRGLGYGATWDDFVDAYGGFIFSNIYYGEYDNFYVDEGLTLREYNEKYLKEYDMNNMNVTVNFDCYYLGQNIYRTIDEYLEAQENPEGHPTSQRGSIFYSVSFNEEGLEDVYYQINED